MTVRLPKSAAFAALPPPWPGDLRPQIREMVAAQPDHKLVVLDDDPTGTQTVRDVPVLTTWDVEALEREFTLPGACFYILTNSRSLAPEPAADLNRQIARNLHAAARLAHGLSEEPPPAGPVCSRAFTLVSRSDSTLRGHYPLETDVLAEELGPFDATILIPYFEAGGRYTLDDIHYVAEDDSLIPAAETPFARDAVFGYRSSNLREYIEEKTGGRVKARDVVSFSLTELRTSSSTHEPIRHVFLKLLGLQAGMTAIVNAASPADMEFFAAATLWAEKAGGRYLFRTAAQFVSARLGLEPAPLWQAATRPGGPSVGGLTIVGSHVAQTTEQLQALAGHKSRDSIERSPICSLELPVTDLLHSELSRHSAIETTGQRINAWLSTGSDVVLFTSRSLMTGADAAASLAIGRSVSSALANLVRRLETRPRYLMAKGGITSSDLATQGLGVKRALVRGQLLPGVPVWELGPEAKFPGLPYIVFPGNVGSPDALWDAIQRLRPADNCGSEIVDGRSQNHSDGQPQADLQSPIFNHQSSITPLINASPSSSSPKDSS